MLVLVEYGKEVVMEVEVEVMFSVVEVEDGGWRWRWKRTFSKLPHNKSVRKCAIPPVLPSFPLTLLLPPPLSYSTSPSSSTFRYLLFPILTSLPQNATSSSHTILPLPFSSFHPLISRFSFAFHFCLSLPPPQYCAFPSSLRIPYPTFGY